MYIPAEPTFPTGRIHYMMDEAKVDFVMTEMQFSVCSFDIFVEEIFTSLLNGAALAIPSDDDKKDIKSLMAFVERHNVTMLSGFPYLLAEMNHLDSIPKSLRLLISGGDVLRGHHVNNLLEKIYRENAADSAEQQREAGYGQNAGCNEGVIQRQKEVLAAC